jgi:hypothetical protein
MHRAPHRPGPKERSLLGPRAVHVGGAQPRAPGPEPEPPRAELLCLDPADQARDIGGMARDVRPMQELRSEAKARQPAGIDPLRFAQPSSSCE